MLHSAWPQPLALRGYPKIELRLGYGPTSEGPATSERRGCQQGKRSVAKRHEMLAIVCFHLAGEHAHLLEIVACHLVQALAPRSARDGRT